MEKTRMWTFVALVGLFAAGDWFVAFTDAGDQEKKIAAGKFGEAQGWFVERDVTVKGKVEKHTFLEITGDYKGELKVSLMKFGKGSEMSRMMPPPVIVRNKSLAVDTGRERAFDLGVKAKGEFFQIIPDGVHRDIRALNVPRVNKLKIALNND